MRILMRFPRDSFPQSMTHRILDVLIGSHSQASFDRLCSLTIVYSPPTSAGMDAQARPSSSQVHNRAALRR